MFVTATWSYFCWLKTFAPRTGPVFLTGSIKAQSVFVFWRKLGIYSTLTTGIWEFLKDTI